MDNSQKSVSFSGERDPRFAYTYSEEEDGEITTIQDSRTGNILDISEEKTVLKDKNGTLLYSYETKSDDDFSGTIEQAGGKEYKVIRTDDSEEFVCAGNQNLIRTYQKNADDKLMSESTKAAGASKNAIESTYTYKTKDLLSGITHKLGNDTVTYSYTYDDNNQLTAVSDGTHTTSYVYDKNKQLIRVNDQKANRTTVVDYDRRSNITSKADYAYTTGNPGSAQGTVSYEYGDSNWKDKLTRFDGKAVTYDAMGNPLSYDGWSYEWEGGRQLKSMQKGSMAIQYSYDANGIRTSKKVGSVTTTYHTVGGRITYQSDGTNTLYFRYNADESLYGLNHNGTEYLYVLNLQGDVVALTDTSGAAVVSYTYDAWGNVTGTSGRLAGTLGSLNPMRYRSYYFDTETGYYYLQSRYYDAGWGRFINADEPELLPTIQVIDSSMNLFVYCNNNPVKNVDITGYLTIPRWVVVAGVDALVWILLAPLGGTVRTLTQPVKALAKKVGQKTIRSKIASIVGKIASALKRHIPKIANVIARVLGKFTKKATKKWATTFITNIISSVFANSVINFLAKNITLLFSVGGWIGLIADFWSDKKLDGKI